MPIVASLSFKLVGSCNLIMSNDAFNVRLMFDLIYPKSQKLPLAGSFTSLRPGDTADFDKGKVVDGVGFTSPPFQGICVQWPTKSSGVSLKIGTGAPVAHGLIFPPFLYKPLIELAGPNVKWPYTWGGYFGEGPHGPYGPYACSYLGLITSQMTTKLNAIPIQGNLLLRSAPIQFPWSGASLPKVGVTGCSSILQTVAPPSAIIAAGVQPSRISKVFLLNKESGLDVGPMGPDTMLPATYVEKVVTVDFSV